jgi:glycosyltransferase involved in cell wall biosynthesis
VKVSVITPSYQNLDWLKLCVESVADQGVALQEHIIQDACSTDGTADWLRKEPRVQAFFEKDRGMYDAVNRGFARARGDILAYLNCDEQYLPGALGRVVDFFQTHPEIDVCVADTLIVDAHGRYLCHKLGLVPGRMGIWVRFPVITAALFMRASALQARGLHFDRRWKDYGDIFFVMTLLREGLKFGVLPNFTSVFTDTGANMNLKPNAQKERKEKESMRPFWVGLGYPWFFMVYLFRQWVRGAFWRTAFSYEIFTRGKPGPLQRTVFQASSPTALWLGRSRWKKIP